MDEHLQGRGDRPAPVWVAFSRRELLTLGGTLAAGGVLAGCARAVDAAERVLSPVGSPAVTANPVASPAPLPVGPVSPEVAEEFARRSIELVNAARLAAGLEALVENPVLSEVAQAYSARMAAEGFYGHEDPQGQDVSDRLAAVGYLAQANAENIAAGQPDPETVVDGWLNSPGHRANIMNPDLREIGAGYATTAAPPYYHYWVHVFATPDASVGRDRGRYPDEALAEINRLRQAAGVGALAADPRLTAVAAAHLQMLLDAAAYADDAQVQQQLDAASQAALDGFTQVVAWTAAGPATPEAVVAKWVEGDDQASHLKPELTSGGVAYVFREQDDYRHYWLLLLAG